MSEVTQPIIHKVVEIQTVKLPNGGAVIYALLEDGSAIGGGMHGVNVEVRSSPDRCNPGRTIFTISGEVNP